MWDSCGIVVLVINMNDISTRLLQAIQKKEYSYGDMAKLTGIPKSAIQRYATGETEKIPLDRLEKMAFALGVSSSYLMGWEEPEEKKQTAQDERHALVNELFDKVSTEDQSYVLDLLRRLSQSQ